MFDNDYPINVSTTIIALKKLLPAKDLKDFEKDLLVKSITSLEAIEQANLEHSPDGVDSILKFDGYYRKLIEDTRVKLKTLDDNYLPPSEDKAAKIKPSDLSQFSPSYKKAIYCLSNCILASSAHLQRMEKRIDKALGTRVFLAAVQNSCNADLMPLQQPFAPLVGMRVKKSQQFTLLDEEKLIFSGGHCYGVVMQWSRQLENCAKKISRTIEFYNYHHMHPFTLEKQENQSMTQFIRKKRYINNALSLHGECHRLIADISASSIYNVDLNFENSAHALGIRRIPGRTTIEIIDPNLGIFTTKSDSEAAQALADIMYFYQLHFRIKSIIYSVCSRHNPDIESTKAELRLKPPHTTAAHRSLPQGARVETPFAYPWAVTKLNKNKTIHKVNGDRLLRIELLKKIEMIEKNTTAYTKIQAALIRNLKITIEGAPGDYDLHGLIFEWAGMLSSGVYDTNLSRYLSNMEVLAKSADGIFLSPLSRKLANLLENLWNTITEHQNKAEAKSKRKKTTTSVNIDQELRKILLSKIEGLINNNPALTKAYTYPINSLKATISAALDDCDLHDLISEWANQLCGIFDTKSSRYFSNRELLTQLSVGFSSSSTQETSGLLDDLLKITTEHQNAAEKVVAQPVDYSYPKPACK